MNKLPVVDWTAGHIPDPLLRLRFLKAAAPVWQEPGPPKPSKPRRRRWPVVLGGGTVLALAAVGFIEAKGVRTPVLPHAPVSVQIAPAPAPPRPESMPQVWPVDKTDAFETYSNGLRIENKYATESHPRSYLAFPAADEKSAGELRSSPAGIVFHTTESLQPPFEPEQNTALKRVGEELLEYVQSKKAYHFVIDRFGRVFRVVREEDAANHAGHSVWADSEWLYINLNESHIGVAVETRTEPGQQAASVTPAQIRAIATLTEMLRARYQIRAENCVTHAQVSVNPARMLAGYHMDWASSFPFDAVGLPDNYAQPLPSVALFGFEYDPAFSRSAGPRLQQSAVLAEQEMARRAETAGVSFRAYRKMLARRYRERVSTIRGEAVSSESGG